MTRDIVERVVRDVKAREYAEETDWENEGGAAGLIAPPLSHPNIGGRPETGFSDKHTLGILQSSLALLVLPLVGIVVFWIAAGAAQGAR